MKAYRHGLSEKQGEALVACRIVNGNGVARRGRGDVERLCERGRFSCRIGRCELKQFHVACGFEWNVGLANAAIGSVIGRRWNRGAGDPLLPDQMVAGYVSKA